MSILETALGALLHDIGKFGQRAHGSREGLGPQSLGMQPFICPTAREGYSTHLHVLWTNEFVETMPFLPAGLDRSIVANLASYHHRPDTPEQTIIALADRLSSGMERQPPEAAQVGSRTAFRRVRLQSVATTVSVPECPAHRPLPLDLRELTPDGAFPLPDSNEADLTEQYQTLWQRFRAAWSENECLQPLGFINRAISVLDRFTWCIPAATNALPDISLSDHLKTTAAIAVCLAQADAAVERPFLLVAGDLTGIQKYIFDIQPGKGGLARRLRARSFKVAAYAESLSLALLDSLGLPLTQRILMAGGKFHLLLPNSPSTREHLAQVKAQVSDWLFDSSGGEVGLALASLPLDENDLRDFPAGIAQINAALREERLRAGDATLINGGCWDEGRFLMPELIFAEGENLCACCGKRAGKCGDPERPDTAVCNSCADEARIGRNLPTTASVAYYSTARGRHAAPLGSFSLLRANELPDGRPQIVINLDGGLQGPSNRPLLAGFRSRYVPVDRATGTVVEFADLAARSQGRPALGYLKMDVDNLGYLFFQGFKSAPSLAEGETRDRTSISRVASLSRTLETFFSGYLELLLRNEFPSVYLIYSGGDDVAAVGPWNEMFDLALRLRQEFASFTGDNPAWTLSAGLAVVHSHLPVLSAVAEADRLLDASKHIVGDGVLPWPLPQPSDGAPRKNRLTALDTSIPFGDLPRLLEQSRQALAWLADGSVSSGQLRRLLGYAEMARQFERTRDTRHLQYLPYLTRDIRRTWKDDTPARTAARQWAAALAKPDSDAMKGMCFVCQYALYANRTSVGKEPL